MTVKQPRWDGDDRGYGVADAGYLSSGARELVAALEQAAWVAEQPEVHLSPHLRGWLEHSDVFELEAARIEPSGEYVVELSMAT